MKPHKKLWALATQEEPLSGWEWVLNTKTTDKEYGLMVQDHSKKGKGHNKTQHRMWLMFWALALGRK